MEKAVQRWTARRKVELLLQVIKGEATLVDVCREHDRKQSVGELVLALDGRNTWAALTGTPEHALGRCRA